MQDAKDATNSASELDNFKINKKLIIHHKSFYYGNLIMPTKFSSPQHPHNINQQRVVNENFNFLCNDNLVVTFEMTDAGIFNYDNVIITF